MPFYPIPENNMQIILLETLNKLGKAGEVVSVKDGFAKNFLICLLYTSDAADE